MRPSIRGWRSARASRVRAQQQPHAQALAAPPLAGPIPFITQEPLRLGLGLVALTFYLWLIHSYKLQAGDIAVVALGIGVLLRGGTLRIPAPLVVFLAFIVWATFGLAVTSSTVVTTNSLISLVKLWIITFCVMNVVRNAAEFRFLVISWLALYALYPVRGALYNRYICHCTEFGRVAWNFVFSNPNDLAALTLLPLGLAAGVAIVERVKFFRLSAMIGTAVLSLMVMLTQSRGAIIALAAAALLIPLTSRRRGRDIVLLVSVFSVAGYFAPKGVWERVAGLANVSVESGMREVDEEGSASSRWQIWKIAVATANQSPLLGVGVGMMPVAHARQAARMGLNYGVRGFRDTHSTYLRIAAEMGYPAMVIYLLMWGTVFWKVRTVRKSLAATRPKDHQFLFYLELAMFAYMVASIFGTYGSLSFTYLSIGVAWLAAMVLEKEPWYGRADQVRHAPLIPAVRRGR